MLPNKLASPIPTKASDAGSGTVAAMKLVVVAAPRPSKQTPAGNFGGGLGRPELTEVRVTRCRRGGASARIAGRSG